MKAIQQNEFGDASVLYEAEVDRPKTGSHEVLIRGVYTSVNYADIKKRTGNKNKGKFPQMLGLDLAGIVEEAPDDSTFSVGDRVIAFPNNGSYAEYVVAKEQLVFKIPETLSFEQAAAMPIVSFLSYILLHEIGQVTPKDTIVIHSAAGGSGSMLVQLAKLAGVEKVIGTIGSMEKAPFVKQLGADLVCTYETFTDVVLKETENLGAQVIFDSVAGEVTRRSLDCLALYGTLVQFGVSSGQAGSISTDDVHTSCRNIKGFSLGTTREHDPARLAPVAEKVIDLFASGKVSLSIAKVFDLRDAALAHQFIESRQHRGKVLIKL